MLAAQKAITISRATGRFLVPSRTTISAPPRVRIPFAEKLVHGFAIFFGLTAIPIYISVNIKHYRGAPAE